MEAAPILDYLHKINNASLHWSGDETGTFKTLKQRYEPPGPPEDEHTGTDARRSSSFLRLPAPDTSWPTVSEAG